jgi:ABC-2 type transport system permease protein
MSSGGRNRTWKKFLNLWKEADMASNAALIEVKDHGRLNGFVPLWRKEMHGWWGTWAWLVKIFLWIAVIDGILAIAIFSVTEESIEQTFLMVFFLLAAMFPAFAVIIFGQDTLIDERILGTAAWVLSKPVSRAAFLLAKLAVSALGVLVSMVLVPGLVAYILYRVAAGIWLSIPGFLAGLGLITLFLLFYLALTIMLGTLFHSRGPVIGIPLVVISCTYLAFVAPWLGEIMPTNMVLSVESGQPTLAAALVLGQPLPTVMPILITGLLVIVFIIVALVRFEREEF